MSLNSQLKQKYHLCKVLLAGTGAVGKTSLMHVLKACQPLEKFEKTLPPYYRTYFIDFESITAAEMTGDGHKGTFQFIDIAGQLSLPIHACRDLSVLTMGEVDLILLLFANDNAQTLLEVTGWITVIQSYFQRRELAMPEIVLIRNKIDLVSTIDDGLLYIAIHNLPISQKFDISCFTGKGIESLKKWMVERFFCS